MSNQDPHKQNIAACIRVADFKFRNNATIEMLYKKVRKVLETELSIKPVAVK
jgi:dephospho-CoA kinase